MLGGVPGLNHLDKIQWVTFRNDAATTAVGGAILRITGFVVTDPENPFFTVDQPNTYGSQYLHAVNDETDVAAGSYGKCCLGQIVPALYDSGDGTPAFGEQWGPRSGTWKLKKNTGGFMVLGVAVSSRSLVLVTPAPMLVLRGQPTADVAAAATGTLTIYTGAYGSEATTGVTMAGVKNNSSCTVKGSQIARAVWDGESAGTQWQFDVGKTA